MRQVMFVHIGLHLSFYKCKACHLTSKWIQWGHRNGLELSIFDRQLFPVYFSPMTIECFPYGNCHSIPTPFIAAESADLWV